MSNQPTIKILLFARLREELGTGELELTAECAGTAGDVVTELARRGGPWAQLGGPRPVMIAVNQAMARPSTPVGPGDEVALFPPVTGG